jgi:hypothetical protein
LPCSSLFLSVHQQHRASLRRCPHRFIRLHTHTPSSFSVLPRLFLSSLFYYTSLLLSLLVLVFFS